MALKIEVLLNFLQACKNKKNLTNIEALIQ
jgi:hypothetical protein